MKRFFLFTAAGIALSVTFTFIGMSVGMSTTEAVTMVPQVCIVADQKIEKVQAQTILNTTNRSIYKRKF